MKLDTKKSLKTEIRENRKMDRITVAKSPSA
jgi:hypothetical protein